MRYRRNLQATPIAREQREAAWDRTQGFSVVTLHENESSCSLAPNVDTRGVALWLVRGRRITTILVSLAALGVSLTVAPGASAATHSAARSYSAGASSDQPLPPSVPATSMSDSSGSVSPLTNTPDGFTLQHPGFRRSDYVYDSDTVYQGTYHCNSSTCTLMAEVTAQLHEVAIGGSSHTWQLTMNMNWYTNPGNYTWSYFATYWCGVNVSGGEDYLCTNGPATSNVSMSVNDIVNKPWGATNNITVFPMVQASTQFSNGVKVTTKFRGWDTLSRASTTKLNTSSGTGN